MIIACSQSASALQERHLIIIRAGEAEHNVKQQFNSNPKHANYVSVHLTEKGCNEMRQTAETLLMHGFDNRNIAAVYISPLPRAVESALIISGIGVFAKDKIHIEKKLIASKAGKRENLPNEQYLENGWLVGKHEAKTFGGESNEQVRKRMLAIYDQIEKKYKNNHVLLVTHGVPATELIEALTNRKVRLQTGQIYLVPLSKRA